MPDKVAQAEADLKELKGYYMEISNKIDELKEKKRAITTLMAEKEGIIEESKRAGWGQVIG